MLHGSAKDNFNFFHSSARIVVECAFGEIELCWGILWRPLQWSLKHNCNIIDACLRLHNFIVDFRENTCGRDNDMYIFDEECRRFLAGNPCESVQVNGGELDDRLDENGNKLVGGRPTNEETAATAYGKLLRDRLCGEIVTQQFVRPATNWWRDKNNLIRDL